MIPQATVTSMANDVFRSFFQVMLFFMLQHPIIGTIHRFECRRDAVYKATDKEKALTLTDGNFLAITNATKLAKCAKQCTSHSQCRSFNFKKTGRNNCQILDIDKANSSGKIENAPGWIHYDPVAMVCNLMLSKLIKLLPFLRFSLSTFLTINSVLYYGTNLLLQLCFLHSGSSSLHIPEIDIDPSSASYCHFHYT